MDLERSVRAVVGARFGGGGAGGADRRDPGVRAARLPAPPRACGFLSGRLTGGAVPKVGRLAVATLLAQGES